MKGKKWLALACMALALVACGQKAQKKATENPEQQSVRKEQKANKLRYQGSYYSVQGADGQEIIIVNKKHPLAANYAPGEDPEAQSAFRQLVTAMQEEGFPISDLIAAIVLMRTKVNYIKIMLLKMGRLKPIVIQPDLAIVNTKQV